jgi:hypothetical protein
MGQFYQGPRTSRLPSATLRKQGGDNFADDMARGSVAYLQMWERADGIANDACRDPDAAKLDTEVLGLANGSTVEQVLRTAGQPHSRLGTTFVYCTKTAGGAQKNVTVTFADAKVASVS